MSKPLIIVESPAKTKTLKNFLGAKFDVEACMGHVRDLPKSNLGVDIHHGFQPKYVIKPERKHLLSHLKQISERAEAVYLATDPDREGEAIAWHLEQALKLKDAKRITFNEITHDAVAKALENPKTLNELLVEAQQARRILDRLVGYKLSPLLWSKVNRKNLSAGRVQSVAVRLICEREEEINSFVPEEYWSLTARLTKLDSEKAFSARLIKKDEKKFKIANEADVQQVIADLKDADYVVLDVQRKEQKRNPAPPFITSTLQQEASRKLGFSNKETMYIAQQLYEGIALGNEGEVGLITYMRTDSTRVAEEAVTQVRAFIQQEFGKEFLPSTPRQYKNKNTAQDAHEAIRPTSVFRKPEDVEQFLTKQQFRLYRLIWQRFVASQMEPALLDVVTVDIRAQNYTFRATGSTLKFPGFTILYTEGKDNGEEEEIEEQTIPDLSKDETLRLLELIPKQHFTEPPPRYTEATLVKALEEKGIGRPSTYATIISTIQDRKYVALKDRKFYPTKLGKLVNDLLVKHFPDIMDVTFTAGVETKLDEIEEGRIKRVDVLEDFWRQFERRLQDAECNIERVKIEPEATGETCPNCGRPLVVREGRSGEFVGCSGYPDCRYIAKYQKEIGVECPREGCDGHVVEKKSKKGRVFYGCDQYPKCNFVSWDKPLGRSCPECGSMLVEKKWRGRVTGIRCSNQHCKYREPLVEQPEAQAVSAS